MDTPAGSAQTHVAHARAHQSLPDWAHPPPQALALMVGPEGGFSRAEETAANAGAIGVSMGPRILRTETAGLTALATLCALWGGMQGADEE